MLDLLVLNLVVLKLLLMDFLVLMVPVLQPLVLDSLDLPTAMVVLGTVLPDAVFVTLTFLLLIRRSHDNILRAIVFSSSQVIIEHEAWKSSQGRGG